MGSNELDSWVCAWLRGVADLLPRLGVLLARRNGQRSQAELVNVLLTNGYAASARITFC